MRIEYRLFLLCLFTVYCLVWKTCAFSIVAKKSTPGREKGQFQPTPNLVNQNFFKKCDPCPAGVACVPAIQCPAHVRMDKDKKPQICDLSHGSHGLCCTTGRNHSANHVHNTSGLRTARSPDGKIMNGVIEEARSHFAGLMSKESKITPVPRSHPEFMHNMVFRSSPQSEMRSMDLSHRALEQVFASQIYKRREHVSNEDFYLNEVPASFGGTPMESTCDQYPQCPAQPSKYRSMDGQCNNLDPAKASWGAAGSPMERLLPPAYDDSVWEPRSRSVTGVPLTNARTISRSILRENDRPHHAYNLLFMQFGQFITHDVTLSSSIKTADGKSVRCCADDGTSVLPPESLHYGCMPIIIEPQDEFYDLYNQRCINFVRSALSPGSECKIGYGKQLSKVSHYLDGSVIYGTDMKTQAEVRAFVGGKLRMLDDFGRDLLPLTMDQDACVSTEKGPCFFAGDARANQIISLAALHILFAREHNRVADILSKLNPQWSDEFLFYETRNIIIGKLQHIIYKEWLPLVIGQDAMARFNLNLRDQGYSDDYNPDLNGCITSEFSSAAMRFGHSIVDSKYIIHQGSQIHEILDIPDVMFEPGRLRLRHFYDEMLLTLTRQSMQQVDGAITYGLSRYLFRGNNPFGLDLAAINIQRGRDHGCRPYNDYVEVNGYRRVNSFDEFGPELGPKLASVYNHPDDIDLWVGGLVESAYGDALVGPTFTEIIADQFSRFRHGDRYFYEHSPEINPGHFTPDQLQEIRKTTMARLICDNADGIRAQSPRAFIRPDVPGNIPLSCDDVNGIPITNYLPWNF